MTLPLSAGLMTISLLFLSSEMEALWVFMILRLLGLWMSISNRPISFKDRHGVSVRSQMHLHTFNNPVVNIDII